MYQKTIWLIWIDSDFNHVIIKKLFTCYFDNVVVILGQTYKATCLI